MEHCTKKPGDEKEIPAFGPDSIEMAMRTRIRETIEDLVQEELDAVLTSLRNDIGVTVRRDALEKKAVE